MDALLLEIKKLIIETLDLEDTTVADIEDDAPLFEPTGLGLDSIDALELGVVLRKKYKLELEANDAANREYFRSVRSLAQVIQSRGEITPAG
jgi:acyl carrier protein